MKIITALAISLLPAATAAAIIAAPQAQAIPRCNPYNEMASGGGGFGLARGYWCDEWPIPGTDVHKHCEWGGFIGYGGACTWRNSANQIVPPPAR